MASDDIREEAIYAGASEQSGPMLFLKIKKSGNALCAQDGPAWVLAERDGKYYSVNGLARSWSEKIRVFRSGKWHTVRDAGVGPSSVFGMQGTSEIIAAADDLCPTDGPGSFIDRMVERMDAGEEQAKRLGSKYGL